MRKKSVRALSLILSIVFIFTSLTSCLENTDIVKEGITVEPGAPKTVSDSARARAVVVIGEILSDYYQKNALSASESEISIEVDRLLSVSLEIEIGDKAYLDFIELLGECGGELISSILSPSADTAASFINAYLEFSSLVSTEYSGNILYGLVLFAYDEKYEEYTEKHESTGKQSYKVLADEIFAKKQVFTSTIDRTDFGALCQLLFFVRGLFVSGALNEGSIAGLLDAEILLLLERFDFSGLDIAPEGYLLLLDYYADTLIIRDNVTYAEELIYQMNYNGDGALLSEQMADIVRLLTTVKESLSAEKIGMLRAGELSEFLSAVFSDFTDDDFLVISRVAECFAAKSSYDKVGQKFYGNDFALYKESGIEKTLDELRLAIGGENFYSALEGYAFGISPAFSYAMSSYDRD